MGGTISSTRIASQDDDDAQAYEENTPTPEFSQHPENIPNKEEFFSSLRAELGIKSCDFAYKSTLPPITPVPHVPRQMQPKRANPLKRRRGDLQDGEPDDDYEPQTLFFDAETGGTTIGRRRCKKKKLERTPTEPADDPALEPVHGPAGLSRRLINYTGSLEGLTGNEFPVPQWTDDSHLFQGGNPSPLQESAHLDAAIVTSRNSSPVPVLDSTEIPTSVLQSSSPIPEPGPSSPSRSKASSDKSHGGSPAITPYSLSPTRQPFQLGVYPGSATTSPSRNSPPMHSSPLARRPPVRSPSRLLMKGGVRRQGSTETTDSVVGPRYNLRERSVVPSRPVVPRGRGSHPAISHHESAVKQPSPMRTRGGARVGRPSRAPRKGAQL